MISTDSGVRRGAGQPSLMRSLARTSAIGLIRSDGISREGLALAFQRLMCGRRKKDLTTECTGNHGEPRSRAMKPAARSAERSSPGNPAGDRVASGVRPDFVVLRVLRG